MVIDKPQMTVKLYEGILRIDVKGSFKNRLEEALENTPVLRETIGSMLELFAPLHVRLYEIESVQADENGTVTIKQPIHRDLKIPLNPQEAKMLTDELNKLIPTEKEKEVNRILRQHKISSHEGERGVENTPLARGPFGSIPPPTGVMDEEKMERQQVEEEEEEDRTEEERMAEEQEEEEPEEEEEED